MKLMPWQKTSLSILVILGGGFVLFNLAFVLAALTVHICDWVVRVVTKDSANSISMRNYFSVFFLIVLIISWLVLRSKENTLLKATYLTMPVMVVLIYGGIQLYDYPKWMPIALGSGIICGLILYLKLKRLPWQYYVSVIYTGLLALYVLIMDVEI